MVSAGESVSAAEATAAKARHQHRRPNLSLLLPLQQVTIRLPASAAADKRVIAEGTDRRRCARRSLRPHHLPYRRHSLRRQRRQPHRATIRIAANAAAVVDAIAATTAPGVKARRRFAKLSPLRRPPRRMCRKRNLRHLPHPCNRRNLRPRQRRQLQHKARTRIAASVAAGSAGAVTLSPRRLSHPFRRRPRSNRSCRSSLLRPPLRQPRAPHPQILRYERERPGELLHVDTKRLGRFHTVGKRILADGVQRSPRAGWQHLHVAIDDHTRIAYCEVLAGQGAEHSCAFLARAVAWFWATHGIRIERVISDNGHAYRSHAWRDLCERLGIERRRTRPYTPRTNGKAEAFIGTALREWAYRYAYPTSIHRSRALSGWVRWYNRRRPHSSLGDRPPLSRVAQVRGQIS